MKKKLSEFDYIQTYLRPLTRGKKEARDLIDDCAYFKKIKGLTISVDSSIEGVHVPSGTDINLQAERSVLRALSDLATFGAKPLCFFSSINIPKNINCNQLKLVARGFERVFKNFDVFLAGGDISSYGGPLCFVITVVGEKAKRIPGRSGAKPGDLIVMSGSLGDAYIGRMLIENKRFSVSKIGKTRLIKKFIRPYPRINTGCTVAKFATSIVDISDGLLSEMDHICKNSKVGANILIENLPLSSDVKNLVLQKKVKYVELLKAGDDYELLYTIDPKNRSRLDSESSVIGQIVKDEGIKLSSKNSLNISIKNNELGYKHF